VSPLKDSVASMDLTSWAAQLKTVAIGCLALLLFNPGNCQLCLKGLCFQVRELQTRLQSVQATGPSSPGRLTPANRPINPSTGELSTSSSSNDIPIAKVSSPGWVWWCRDTSYLKNPAVAEPTVVQAYQYTSSSGFPWDWVSTLPNQAAGRDNPLIGLSLS
jgi:hypothetical protein